MEGKKKKEERIMHVITMQFLWEIINWTIKLIKVGHCKNKFKFKYIYLYNFSMDEVRVVITCTLWENLQIWSK